MVSWDTWLKTAVVGSKKVSSSTSSKGEDVGKVERKPKKGEKPLICYNCGGRGHTSRQCLSEAFFVGQGSRLITMGQPFCCEGLVEGQFVNDIVLDTGCSRTLVKSDLVREESREDCDGAVCTWRYCGVPCGYCGD